MDRSNIIKYKPVAKRATDLIDEVPEAIDLPELNVEGTAVEGTIDKSVMEVLLQDPSRNITITSAHRDNIACFYLPIPPDLLRRLVEGHKHVRVSQSGNEIAISSAQQFNDKELVRFIGLRNDAEKILRPLYRDLFATLSCLNGVKYELNKHGAKVLINDIDLSHFYAPSSLVSSYLAARSIGQIVTFNQYSEKGSDYLVPEITGDVSYEDICLLFNDAIEKLRPEMHKHGIYTAFVTRSQAHDGLDICSIKRDGNGGYVNISRDLALHMFGTQTFKPEFLQEGDMIMVSVDAGEPFVCADAAQWINFEAWNKQP